MHAGGGGGGGDCRSSAGLLERHGPFVDLFVTRAREPVPGDCPCPCPPQEEAEKEKHAALEAARREAEAGEALRREQAVQAVRGLACVRACICDSIFILFIAYHILFTSIVSICLSDEEVTPRVYACGVCVRTARGVGSRRGGEEGGGGKGTAGGGGGAGEAEG
jgi:hypothetical protein